MKQPLTPGATPPPQRASVAGSSLPEIERALRSHSDHLQQEQMPDRDLMVQIAHDLTQLADRVAQSYKTRIRFLNRVAHDMSPLLIFANYCITKLGSATLPADQRDSLDKLQQEILKLNRLLEDLRRQAQRESGAGAEAGAAELELRRAPVDLSELVRRVVERRRMFPQYGIQVVMQPQAAEAYAYIDAERIEIILNELIDNAYRFVQHDGQGRIELDVGVDTTMVYLHVKDNGIGISPEHQPRIFDTFYQVEGPHRGKSGHGLAIARHTIHAHGGTLKVESVPNNGATFLITLPRSERPAGANRTSSGASGTSTPVVLRSRLGFKYSLGRTLRVGAWMAHEAIGEDGAHYWIKQVPATDEAAIARLRSEAELLERLDHRQLIKLVDRGRSQSCFFIVLEAAAGRPLQQITEIAARQPLDPGLVQHIAIQLARLMGYLHGERVICRSLPPSSIYIDSSDRIMLADLSAAWSDQQPLNDELPENLLYISPEQINGADTGRRSDIYVFGLLLFELLAGRPPFQHTNRDDLALDHIGTPPPSLLSLRPDLPPLLATLVERCLVKSSIGRYSDTVELLAAIARIDAVEGSELAGDQDRPTTNP